MWNLESGGYTLSFVSIREPFCFVQDVITYIYILPIYIDKMINSSRFYVRARCSEF